MFETNMNLINNHESGKLLPTHKLWSQMERFVHHHLIQLSKPILKNEDSPRKLNSEELKNILNSLCELIVAILGNDECRKNFFSMEFRPAFGHLISTLLNTFSDINLDSQIRLISAKILEKLTNFEFRDESADSLAFILPGFFVNLQKIIKENLNSPVTYQISKNAILLIANLLTSTLWMKKSTDYENEEKICIPTQKKTENLSINRNSQWIQMAVGKIQPQLISILALLIANRNHHLRIESLETLIKIKNLQVFGENFDGVVLDSCSILFNDSYPKIKDLVNILLSEFRQTNLEFFSKHFSKKLTKMRKTFKKTIQNSTSGHKQLENLINCLEILGPNLLDRLICASPDFFELLIPEILTVINVNIQRLLISSSTSSSSILTTNENPIGVVVEKQDFIKTLPLCNGINGIQLLDLSNSLASISNVDTVYNFILDNFQMGTVKTKISSGLLLSTMCLKSKRMTKSCPKMANKIYWTSFLEQFIRLTTNYLNELENLLEIDVRDDKIQDYGRGHSQETCLAAILLNGLTLALIRLNELDEEYEDDERKNQNDYYRFLIDTIYELLKWSASTNFFVRETAEKSLQLLARANKFDTVAKFLSINSTFVVFKVSLGCKNFEQNARAPPLVLSQFLEKCSTNYPEIFEQIKNIIQEMLITLDRNNQKKTTLLLRAIRNYVRCLRKCFAELKPPPEAKFCAAEFDEADLKNEKDSTTENYENNFSAINEADEKRKKLQYNPYIQSAVDVLNRTKQLISSNYLPIQLLVLDILDEALKFVQYYEDSLLPMIHQNWHGLVNKLSPGWSCTEISDSQQLVAAKAITVIETMCQVSGDFIYHKIANELNPKLIKFMEESWKNAENLANRTYCQSANFKLQSTILKAIPIFIMKCTLNEEHRQPLIGILEKYTKTRDENLREIAKNSLKNCL